MKTIGTVAMAGMMSLLAGCSGSEVSTGDAESDLTGEHFKATHCEVFVDRVAPFFAQMNVSQLTIYLKTPVDKLSGRGGVKSAGLHAQIIQGGNRGPFQDFAAMRFPSSDDYWTLDLDMFDVQRGAARTFRGAFWVEANDGTRFWLNASEGGQDFVLDSNLLSNLQKQRPPGFFSNHGSTSPSAAVAPADQFPYLNAERCR